MKDLEPEKILIRFDGICVLCSSFVRLLLKLDRKRKFIFQVMPESSPDEALPSVIVIHETKTYEYSEAVLKICCELGGIFRILLIIRIIPRSWRDRIYLWIARNRYKWFGKNKTCFVVRKTDASRFI